MNLDLARENKAKAKFEIKLSEGGTELDFLKKSRLTSLFRSVIPTSRYFVFQIM